MSYGPKRSVPLPSPLPWRIETTWNTLVRIIDAEGFPVAEKLFREDAEFIIRSANGKVE
jgi:hypothetical protein